MKTFFFCIALIITSTYSWAQQTYGDSILQSNLADTTKLRLLRPWIKANVPNLREPVLRVALEAVQVARKTGDPTLMARAWNDLGSTYFYQEKPEESGNAFSNGRYFALQSGDVVSLMIALRGMTHYYREKGDIVRALEMVHEMETLMPQIKDPTLVSTCYVHFCNTYTALNRWKDVENLARRAIEFNLKNQLFKQLPGAYYHLGKSLETNNVLDSALFYMQKAKAGFAAINNQEELAGMTMQIAQILSRLDRPEEAVREMEAALQIVEQNRDTAGIAYVSMEKGKMMLLYGRAKEAKAALLRSVSIFEKLNIIAYKKDIYTALSDFYEKTGDPAASLLYFKKYVAIRDTIESAESQKQLAELEAKFENSKKEQKIALLSQENDNQRLQIGLLIAIAALLSAGALAGFLFIRNRQRKASMLDQKRWAKTVVDSTESVQQRIASDLHDGIAQQIAALKMMASGLLRKVPEDQRAQVENLVAQLNQTGQEVRQLSHQMMPRSLGELGLDAALEDLFWLSFSNTPIQPEIKIDPVRAPLNNDSEVALYRIAQEAVNNILKHARATAVQVSLYSDESAVYLNISDNGRGMAADAKPSLGMQSMGSRANLCNGHFEIRPNAQGGVSVAVSVPI